MQKVRLGYFLYTTKATQKNQIPLYVKIRVNGTVTSISTGCNIPRELWDEDTKRLRGNSTISLHANNRLKLIESTVYDHAYTLEKNGKVITAQILKDFVLGKNIKPTVRDAMREYLKMVHSLIGNRYSSNTYEKYKLTETRIIEFMESKLKVHDMQLIHLNDAFLIDFEVFLRSVYRNSHTTCAKQYQRFSAMIRFAHKKQMVEKYPFETYRLRPIQKEVTFLTKEEVDLIMSGDFGESLNRVRDCFGFAIYTGLAYRELLNLSDNHIIKGFDGEEWIKIRRQKTKKEVKIPLLPKAKEILIRNNPNGFDGKLLPVISNVKFNKYLKIIAQKCGITNTPLTVHLGRRTFACTILMLNNVPLEVISECLGHATINVTARAYTKVFPKLLKSHFDRLKTVPM